MPAGVFVVFEVLMYKVKAGQNFLGQNFDNNGVTLTFTTPGAVNPAEDEFIEMELECVLLPLNSMILILSSHKDVYSLSFFVAGGRKLKRQSMLLPSRLACILSIHRGLW
jgi:hypothetical protein